MTDRCDPEVTVGDDATLQGRLCAVVGEAARRAIAERGRWSMAIPGGSVATRLLPTLVRDDIPWRDGDLFWVDERAVPWSHADSNYGQSRDGWIADVVARGGAVHPMPVDLPRLDDCARRYEATLRERLGPAPVLDVAVLGVGEDGHVASIFPGDAGLDDADRLVIAVDGAPKPPLRRLTMTMAMLARAPLVIVAAFGEGKRAAIGSALAAHDEALPISRLLSRSPAAVLLLDVAAAGMR